jgi:hypothetical protein
MVGARALPLDAISERLTLGRSWWSGEENRTLMTSLEGVPHCTVMGVDLCIWVAGDDRSWPSVASGNGTLMARRSTAARLGHLLGRALSELPWVLQGGKGLPAGSIEASPCRWRGSFPAGAGQRSFP